MELVKKRLYLILISVSLIFNLAGCVGLLVVRENISELEDDDKKIMQQLQGNFNQSEETLKLIDSVAYYKKETKLLATQLNRFNVTVHRFFFKRAEYTDSLYNGFSIMVVELGNNQILIENQDNVSLAITNLGQKQTDWQSQLNNLTSVRKPYDNLTDEGLMIKTLIRSLKM